MGHGANLRTDRQALSNASGALCKIVIGEQIYGTLPLFERRFTPASGAFKERDLTFEHALDCVFAGFIASKSTSHSLSTLNRAARHFKLAAHLNDLLEKYRPHHRDQIAFDRIVLRGHGSVQHKTNKPERILFDIIRLWFLYLSRAIVTRATFGIGQHRVSEFYVAEFLCRAAGVGMGVLSAAPIGTLDLVGGRVSVDPKHVI